MDDLRHHIIKGRYRLQRLLGVGGMASAYLAEDQLVHRPVVVKVLRADSESEGEGTAAAQFLQEARTLAALDHPHIIRIHNFGQFRGQPFMVMEYLANGSLSRRLAEFQDHQQAAALLAQIADALHYAHSRGVVHRDVKPDNILFDAADQPRLSDFGIVALLPRVSVPQPFAQAEQHAPVLSGTPQYMAPELWRGEVHPQADQYALGVMFYELLTGEWPYSGTSPWEYGDQHLEAPIPSARQVVPWLPREVDGVLRRMLAKDPQARFRDLSVAADALRALAKIPLSPRQIERARARRRKAFRPRWQRLLWAGIILLLLAGLAAVLLLW
jgi:serine/threonine protein kinase